MLQIFAIAGFTCDSHLESDNVSPQSTRARLNQRFLNDGPYTTLLRKLSRLQDRLPQIVELVEFSPIRIAIVTARNSPAEMRVIKTPRHWGVYVDEIFFPGGLDKSKILKTFKAPIFFDDQDVHLDPAAKLVLSSKVPYKTDSPLKTCDKVPPGTNLRFGLPKSTVLCIHRQYTSTICAQTQQE